MAKNDTKADQPKAVQTEETAMRYSDEDFLKDSLELAKTAGIDEVGPLKMCVWGGGVFENGG